MEAAEKIQESEYFARILDVFAKLPDDDSKRDYCSVIKACFDPNDGVPKNPQEVAKLYGFSVSKLHSYRFVLAKRHAKEFFVRDCDWPGVTASDIKKIGEADYKKKFGRDPFTRGRSKFWFTVAEWVELLGINGSAPLPSDMAKFLEGDSQS